MRLKSPIISNAELEAIKTLKTGGWKTKKIDITYEKNLGNKGLKQALISICKKADQAIADGFSFIVLSDKSVNKDKIAISALVACSTVHHYLVKSQKRTRIGLVIETGEAREVHHHCLLFGYGADAINPYLCLLYTSPSPRD